MFFLKKFREINFLHIPPGIRLISWATAIRYIGWGFVEVFIPVFLLSFTNNFAEIGFIRSVYDIVYLAALPVVSHLADRVSSKKIMLSGLVLYPLIALGYFFAGVYGAVIFVVIARCINGISFALDSVGKMTYMRRHSKDRIGIILGYFETLANFWWLVAGVAGLFLIKIVPIHVLFLLIIPTVLVAIFLISKISEHSREHAPTGNKIRLQDMVLAVGRDYALMIGFIWRWTIEQKYISILYAYLSIVFVVISFFLPLVSFAENQSYTMVFLLTALAILPMLFGVPLGWLADKANWLTLRRMIFLVICFLITIPFLSAVSFVYTLVAVFILGLCLNYSMLVLERSATDHESRGHMGSLSGAFLSVSQAAQVVAPICIGFFIDRLSAPIAIWIVCVIGLVLIVPMYLKKIRI